MSDLSCTEIVYESSAIGYGDELSSCPVRAARDEKGRVVFPNDKTVGPLLCLGCGGPLTLRRQHQRARLNSATGTRTVFQVRAHFVHVGGVTSGQCSAESAEHATAKALLVQFPDHPMSFCCMGCGTERPFGSLPDGRRVLEQALDAGRLRVDVAILGVDNASVIGAIEVHHTHACDDSKLAVLQEQLAGCWCEVRAADVLSSLQCNCPVPVSCCPVEYCSTCVLQQRETLQRKRCRLLETLETTSIINTLESNLQWAQKELTRAVVQLQTTQQTLSLSRIGRGQSCTEHTLTFGRYSGVSLEILMKQDPRYVCWLATSPPGCNLPSDYLEAARKLTKGLCRRCACHMPTPTPEWKTLCLDCWQAGKH